MNAPLHDDADDLLHWLNAHSVSISDGIPISSVQQKWIATQRPHELLKAALESLFAQEMVSLTPGLSPHHVRLSVKGFQHLIISNDRARLTAEPVAAPVPVAPTPTVSVTAPAVPALAPQPAPVLAAAPASTMPELVRATAANTRNFLVPGKPPTEIALRNQVLHIFRDLKLMAGQQLIAMTLTRYWQEAGLRGEYLRLGIDILLRDRYLEQSVKRYENYWLLTADGHAYLSGTITPPNLLVLAAPLTKVGDGYADSDLRKAARKLLAEMGSGTAFEALFARWRHGRDALIHAIDLLIKVGDLKLEDGPDCRCSLTAQGMSKKR